MAAKKKTTKSKKKLDVKVKMIGELIDATGSSKDSWNPAEISDDMKAISYIRKLADTWNPAQLNEALKYLGFATIDSWNPAIIEETKNKLVKYFLPTNASGNPIELDLKGVLPYEVTALTIDLLPIQDLHGYDSPWAGGAGKNKLDSSLLLDQVGWNTFTIQLKANTEYTMSSNIPQNTTGELPLYFLSGSATPGSGTLVYSGHSVTMTSDENGEVRIQQRRVSGTDSFQDYQWQIEEGNQATSFAPYSNICPISGRNSVTLTVNGEDTETEFQQTVYGGTVNVIEGGTSSTYGYIASYDGEELPGAWISDRDAYAAGTSPTTGAEVAYILATPDELTTSAEEVTLLNGENTLSTDGDTINITYKAILNS